MILKQLKQFTFSATRRNVDVKRLARFYGSPAVCESLTTSKAYKRLSRDDRRALVESFVNEYRANNAGRFPSLSSTRKEVGGCYYVVREILQELKLKPKAPMPIVAKALSEVSPSVPCDASSHFSPAPVPIVAKPLSEVPPSVPDDASSHFSPVVVEPEIQAGSLGIETVNEQKQDIIDTSHSNSDDESNLQGNNLVISATDDKRETETTQRIEVEVCLKNSETEEEGNLTHIGNQESKADHLGGAAGTGDKRQTETTQGIEVDVCSNNSETKEEGNLTHLGNQESKADHLEGAVATDEKRETDTTQGIQVDISLKNSETEKEGNLTHLGNQGSKADHLEGAAVSADVVPTETRQVSEAGAGEAKETEAGEVKERSSAWSNIMSFAKEFTNFWRKM
ncbi:uncharacterized protein LOC9300632 [Arabidopsis lyrata subsp. lyrata]|uniref:uncharacterized protein LOC9300632 n=1 Tax=Arabidopsis lyrata subsp. lyrata TaxID=81972 RepID=UPI000A29D51D|nr:uncharacterized protein LOC9300632 [Arabidopsis lyrata subsp. lyrata]XP_020878305.1 uncharacterized protein LOC9300632 [Arabidopsis lyrata subsp. lyrata]XP_020878309.1 uncharacterized protein LOC9300632 [Arabidopsis lyrata subsp. lyrata]XP_020878316.1 uncharacterized protein LOC9300632 [Arabidopsis lyrata subsp. lyrata]|eukprot:XP_020878298.1 uncharacterized protein LOC9300632 [Arabidopsis lyrata subsp. lyrata]